MDEQAVTIYYQTAATRWRAIVWLIGMLLIPLSVLAVHPPRRAADLLFYGWGIGYPVLLTVMMPRWWRTARVDTKTVDIRRGSLIWSAGFVLAVWVFAVLLTPSSGSRWEYPIYLAAIPSGILAAESAERALRGRGWDSLLAVAWARVAACAVFLGCLSLVLPPNRIRDLAILYSLQPLLLYCLPTRCVPSDQKASGSERRRSIRPSAA